VSVGPRTTEKECSNRCRDDPRWLVRRAPTGDRAGDLRERAGPHSGRALINAVTRSSAPAQAPTRDETCRDGCGSGPRWVKRQVFPGSEPRGTAAVDDPALASPHCWPTWSYPHWTVVHRSTTCSPPSWCGWRGRTHAGGTCGSRVSCSSSATGSAPRQSGGSSGDTGSHRRRWRAWS